MIVPKEKEIVIMRKTSIMFLTVVSAVCMALGISFLSGSHFFAKAETVNGAAPTLSATKILRSKDGERILVATGINDYSDCYECGYLLNGAEAVTYDTNTYYTSVSTKGGTVWTVKELFPDYSGMIVWEIRAHTFSTDVKPYVKVGDRVDGKLYPKSEEEIVYGNAKAINFSAIELSDAYGYSSDNDPDFVCEDFASSGKALTFKYKPVGDRLSGDSDDVTFSLMSGWNRVTAYITVDITNNNVRSNDIYIGKVKNEGDGWYKVTINFAETPVNSAEGATGSETVDRINFHWVNHGFLISDISIEDEATAFSSEILVVSDVHVNADDDNSKQHLKNTLLYANDNGVSAVIFNGDTVNLSREEDYAALDAVFTEVYGVPKSEGSPTLIFNMGNHEFYPTGNCAHEETDYAREFAKFKAFTEKWGEVIEDNVFVRDINGVKCVFAFPSDERTYIQDKTNNYANAGDTVYLAASGGYSQNDVNKVKDEFDEILSANYDKPIVFFTHHPLGETYGSTIYGMDQSAENWFKDMLKDYPMVVHLTGHTHFSSLHERSIAQEYYTAIQIGMHTYGKYVTGVDKDENGEYLVYDNITGKQYNTLDQAAKNYHGHTHFGLLLTFGEDSMTADRVELTTGEIYPNGQWVVPYGITSSNYHDKFFYEAGERTGATLTFGEDTDLVVNVKSGAITQISFKDVDEFRSCEGYEITVKDASDNIVKRILWASHYWMGLDEKQTYTIPVKDMDTVSYAAGYKVSVRAINFFGYYSDPCIINAADFTVEGAPIIEVSSPFGYSSDDDADFVCENFAQSGKALTFRYKPVGDRLSGESDDVTFSLQSGWDRVTAYITVDITNNNVRSNGVYIGMVEDAGDGWYKVTVNFSEMPLNNASGAETVDRLYFHWVNHAFLFADVEIVNAYRKPIEMSASGDCTPSGFSIDSFATSGKALTFEYKRVDDGKAGKDVTFSLMSDWNRVTAYITVDLTNNNVRSNDVYIGMVEDAGDGWYKASINFTEIPLYNSTGAETVSRMYFHWVDHAFLIANVGITNAYRSGIEISKAYDYTASGFSIENFAQSGKALSFEYKPVGDRLSGDSDDVTFSLQSGWSRVTAYITVDITNNTVRSNDVYIGKVEDAGDGWCKVTVNFADMPLDNASGSETVDRMYFHWVNHGFLLANVGIVNAVS